MEVIYLLITSHYDITLNCNVDFLVVVIISLVKVILTQYRQLGLSVQIGQQLLGANKMKSLQNISLLRIVLMLTLAALVAQLHP